MPPPLLGIATGQLGSHGIDRRLVDLDPHFVAGGGNVAIDVARVALRMVPGWLARRTAWGRERELPVWPKESFREWYQRSGRG